LPKVKEKISIDIEAEPPINCIRVLDKKGYILQRNDGVQFILVPKSKDLPEHFERRYKTILDWYFDRELLGNEELSKERYDAGNTLISLYEQSCIGQKVTASYSSAKFMGDNEGLNNHQEYCRKRFNKAITFCDNPKDLWLLVFDIPVGRYGLPKLRTQLSKLDFFFKNY